jgi:hypothetical protein
MDGEVRPKAGFQIDNSKLKEVRRLGKLLYCLPNISVYSNTYVGLDETSPTYRAGDSTLIRDVP